MRGFGVTGVCECVAEPDDCYVLPCTILTLPTVLLIDNGHVIATLLWSVC